MAYEDVRVYAHCTTHLAHGLLCVAMVDLSEITYSYVSVTVNSGIL